MPYVTKHDGKEEWERDHGEQTRVHFLIRCNAIAVHDGLEPFGELVRTYESRRLLAGTQFMQDRRHIRTGILLRESQSNDVSEGKVLTVACRNPPWMIGMSLVGTQPSAINVFRRRS